MLCRKLSALVAAFGAGGLFYQVVSREGCCIKISSRTTRSTILSSHRSCASRFSISLSHQIPISSTAQCRRAGTPATRLQTPPKLHPIPTGSKWRDVEHHGHGTFGTRHPASTQVVIPLPKPANFHADSRSGIDSKPNLPSSSTAQPATSRAPVFAPRRLDSGKMSMSMQARALALPSVHHQGPPLCPNYSFPGR